MTLARRGQQFRNTCHPLRWLNLFELSSEFLMYALC
jgi:hypothetical protein